MPRPPSLLRQANWRLGSTFLCLVALTLGACLWAYFSALDRVNQAQVRARREHYAGAMAFLQARWEKDAIRFKARMEFMRILRDPATRDMMLSGYLAVQNIDPPFQNVFLENDRGQIIFSGGSGAERIPPEHLGVNDAWCFVPEGRMLHRIFRQPVSLGPDGVGRLILLRRADHSLLAALDQTGDQVFLAWGGNPLASNLGREGLERMGSLSLDEYARRNRGTPSVLAWSGSEAGEDGPEPVLWVVHPGVELFTPAGMALGLGAVILGLTTPMWLVSGVWLVRTIRRIGRLAMASRVFSRDRTLTPGVETCLEAARDNRMDEVAEAAEAFRSMARDMAAQDARNADQALELRQAHAELELRVEARTRELALAMEDLRQARDLAESASRMKSGFLASVSHELKTPLTPIIGMTEILQDSDLSPEQRGCLEEVLGGARRLERLLDRLIELTGLESRQFRPRPLGLSDVLDLVRHEYQSRATEKGLRFEACLEPGAPQALLTDLDLLRPTLDHLMENAVKFTDQGWVSLRVARETGVSGPEGILFTVADSGPGIPADRMAEVTRGLTQAENPLTRRHGGLGLGLAVVRKAVSLMGGTLDISSGSGQGTRVEVRLPLFECPEDGVDACILAADRLCPDPDPV